jgi:hypothetical protein
MRKFEQCNPFARAKLMPSSPAAPCIGNHWTRSILDIVHISALEAVWAEGQQPFRDVSLCYTREYLPPEPYFTYYSYLRAANHDIQYYYIEG